VNSIFRFQHIFDDFSQRVFTLPLTFLTYKSVVMWMKVL